MCELIAAGTIWAFVACHLNISWTYAGLAGWGFQVERCQGQSCSNFVEVGHKDRFPITASYSFKDDQILLEATTYCYRLKAGYGAGTYADWTWGLYSPSQCATTSTFGTNQSPKQPQNIKVKQP